MPRGRSHGPRRSPSNSKIGVASCPGEELAEGIIARMVTLEVLHELRPRETVTVSLPEPPGHVPGGRDLARGAGRLEPGAPK
jgi:hypothetical protein